MENPILDVAWLQTTWPALPSIAVSPRIWLLRAPGPRRVRAGFGPRKNFTTASYGQLRFSPVQTDWSRRTRKLYASYDDSPSQIDSYKPLGKQRGSFAFGWFGLVPTKLEKEAVKGNREKVNFMGEAVNERLF